MAYFSFYEWGVSVIICSNKCISRYKNHIFYSNALIFLFLLPEKVLSLYSKSALKDFFYETLITVTVWSRLLLCLGRTLVVLNHFSRAWRDFFANQICFLLYYSHNFEVNSCGTCSRCFLLRFDLSMLSREKNQNQKNQTIENK